MNVFLELGATECPAPEHPKHGTVLVTAASASYHCFKGYAIRGTQRIYCSEDGIWNGVPPQCESKEYYFMAYCQYM